MGRLATVTTRVNVGLSFFIASLMLLGVSASPAGAVQTAFYAVINSGQEPPPNTNSSKAFGVAFLIWDDTTPRQICFMISYDDSSLTSIETEAHLHFSAPPGAHAPARITLPLGAPKNGCATADPPLTDQDIRDLYSSLWYINVSTQMNPGGEIRGQLLFGPIYGLP